MPKNAPPVIEESLCSKAMVLKRKSSTGEDNLRHYAASPRRSVRPQYSLLGT
jgi:hypothetical protein